MFKIRQTLATVSALLLMSAMPLHSLPTKELAARLQLPARSPTPLQVQVISSMTLTSRHLIGGAATVK